MKCVSPQGFITLLEFNNKNIEIKSENFQITRIVMSKVMQNLVVMMEPSKDAWRTPLKGGNMILNRFCIDEDAAFELSGVNYLKKYIPYRFQPEKGKEYSFWRSYFIL